jgi:hypothetical protein
VKVGDLVTFKNLHEDWGKVGLITRIHITDIGTGQISMIANGRMCAIPWLKREHYIKADEVPSECG